LPMRDKDPSSKIKVQESWHLQMIEYVLNYFFRGDLFCFRFIADDDAVAKDVIGDGFDVLRRHVAAAIAKGLGLGRERQLTRRPAATALLDVLRDFQPEIVRSAGRMDDVHDVPLYFIVHVKLIDLPLQGEDVLGR